ncbi:MAG: hypothetical protein ABFE13_14730 [Phycisphaerales bacterium]
MAVSGGLAVVGFQQAAQTLNADDLALVSFVPWLDDLVDALMNPLVMVVFQILGQGIPQLLF